MTPQRKPRGPYRKGIERRERILATALEVYAQRGLPPRGRRPRGPVPGRSPALLRLPRRTTPGSAGAPRHARNPGPPTAAPARPLSARSGTTWSSRAWSSCSSHCRPRPPSPPTTLTASSPTATGLSSRPSLPVWRQARAAETSALTRTPRGWRGSCSRSSTACRSSGCWPVHRYAGPGRDLQPAVHRRPVRNSPLTRLRLADTGLQWPGGGEAVDPLPPRGAMHGHNGHPPELLPALPSGKASRHEGDVGDHHAALLQGICRRFISSARP